MDRVTIQSSSSWRAISEDMWGVFFEDINYSADGGLAAEMVRNGSFTFTRADSEHWNGFTAWHKVVPESSAGAFCLSDRDALADENPVHAVVEVNRAPIALVNEGFDGMRIRAGVDYRCSLWVWPRGNSSSANGGSGCDDIETVHKPMHIRVSLLDDDGSALACEMLTLDTLIGCGDADQPRWRQERVVLHPKCDAMAGRLELEFLDEGTVEIDFVSLEPDAPWHGNELLRHLRADIIEALAELHPRFMRFPGGCIAHGYGLSNMYHWKHTIGPVEHRRQQFNCWGYHQSFRLGYFEYLCLCEAIGAKPLPVVAAGVCCQNSDSGATAIPCSQMGEYVQDVLDLIEFCNGDVGTRWGSLRADLGHPEPFGLEMIGIGNEDRIDDVFVDRFTRIYDAVRRQYPNIRIVGTVGPALFGQDYEDGWALARRLRLPLVDEHSYQSPAWWFRHLDQYDRLPRSGPKVYLGEYESWGSAMLNALSEAALMTSMERNGDVVAMASYAPLLCRNGHASWNPNLIYFDNDRVYDTCNYWVQWMFSRSAANRVLPVSAVGDVTYRRELPLRSRLQCEGQKGQWFGDIRVETADDTVYVGRDVRCLGHGEWLDCGLNWSAESYVIRLRTRIEQLPASFRIGFGDIEDVGLTGSGVSGDRGGHDHNEVVFNVSASRLRYEILMTRDGYDTSYAEPTLCDVSMTPGQEITIVIRVDRGGRTVGVSVDGGAESVAVESDTETRRVVGVAHDDTRGLTVIRMVNALADPVDVDCSAVLESAGVLLRDVTCTVLSGDPSAGVGGKTAPCRPVRQSCDTVDARHIVCPGWSFTVLEIPDAGSGAESVDYRE
ncbi:alpha-L-arabinofuranosidase [Bifidobacterium goeldii]|uniref:non-reducing end alpha-L-arabinofuranosidase n=1 Tax=Bifidobacterium goeldii TaxID=2306975 RepID=A0A430FLK3_9BIFI|nr:alpha-L-arabinofuranosidase C-terminal domain-containing protein [Bifidobacterium goeldii]RSX53598.1 alpha-L-arabinofuranosidase [Bifidobacterium goeldii]